MIKVYTLSNCGTCRNATKWLRAHGIEFDERAIRETPPTMAELRRMLAAYEGEVRRLFNTSGEDYRAQKMAEKLPAISEADALALLAKNGRSITLLPSTGKGGALSRIVPQLEQGTVVTVPRQFADIVVTEHGVAHLLGKSDRERAEELISIAHPDHRAELRKQAAKLLGL